MDNHVLELITQIHELCHRIEGYLDLQEDLKPKFQIYRNPSFDSKILPFPTKKATPERPQTLKEINEMLVELNIKINARQRADGLFEIRPTIGGVRKSFYGRTADELAKKYNDYLNKKVKKKTPKIRITLFNWLDEWLEVFKKPNIAEKTYYNYTLCIRKHIKGNLSDKPINCYTLSELTQALNKIGSTRMRKYARGIIHASFSSAVINGHLKESPAENLLPVKHISQKGKAIPLSDLNEMIEQANEKLRRPLLLYYLFCLFSGARREEALELRGDDCDFKNKIVYFHGTKTEGSDRRIPMTSILEKILSKLKPEKARKVFPIGLYTVNVNFKYFKGVNSKAVLHWLRHTFGTIQICVHNIPANTVSLWLGHSDPAMTMRYYTHPEDLAPDIYFSGRYSEIEKNEILKERYNKIISTVEEIIELPPILPHFPN